MSEHGLCCVECHASGTAKGEHAGATVERERIIALIKGAPVSFDWFQPFVGTTTLIQQINGEQDGNV